MIPRTDIVMALRHVSRSQLRSISASYEDIIAQRKRRGQRRHPSETGSKGLQKQGPIWHLQLWSWVCRHLPTGRVAKFTLSFRYHMFICSSGRVFQACISNLTPLLTFSSCTFDRHHIMAVKLIFCLCGPFHTSPIVKHGLYDINLSSLIMHKETTKAFVSWAVSLRQYGRTRCIKSCPCSQFLFPSLIILSLSPHASDQPSSD